MKDGVQVIYTPRELIDEFDGLTADDISRMSMREFDRRRQRAGLPSMYEPVAPGPATATAQQMSTVANATPAQEPQGVSLEDMTMEEYVLVRGQLGVGGSEYGRGIFDGASREAQVAATARQSGRGALSNRNVTMPPRIDMGSRLVPDPAPVQGRDRRYYGS